MKNATLEQRRKWTKTWKDKCINNNRCIACGKQKEDERRKFLRCKKCQRRQDLTRKGKPQVRPNGRKLMQSIHNVLCIDCQPKIKDLESFWYDRR